MRKINVERKIDLALNEAVEAYKLLDFADPVMIDCATYHVGKCISYLCMLDDYVVEENSTYYCLSEIEHNLNFFIDERKRKQNENGDK